MDRGPISEELLNDDGFQEWLRARDRINQAKGIVMERFRLDGEAAFAVLIRLSQHTNRKIRDIAEELVHTGRLPEDPFGRG